MEQIKLTHHQLNRLENLRMQASEIEKQMKQFCIDVIDAVGKTVKEGGQVKYENGVLSAELVPHAQVIKNKLKKVK